MEGLATSAEWRIIRLGKELLFFLSYGYLSYWWWITVKLCSVIFCDCSFNRTTEMSLVLYIQQLLFHCFKSQAFFYISQCASLAHMFLVGRHCFTIIEKSQLAKKSKHWEQTSNLTVANMKIWTSICFDF